MNENENENVGNVEDVKVEDLLKVEFPKVNENAVNALNGVATPKTENDELKDFNPDIHETPPRKNRFGEWAKKRGNKKGFGFGKTKTETEPPKTETEKPPLEIPQNPQEAAAAIENENNIETQTAAAAAMMSMCFYKGLEIWSDYEANPIEMQAHKAATYKYLMSRGGCDLPPWAEVAAISAQSIYAASQKEKAQGKIHKFKSWIVGKIYAFKNRKNSNTTETRKA